MLPLEILKHISMQTPRAYFALACASKQLQYPDCEYIMRYFTVNIAGYYQCRYTLPNGMLHVGLDDKIPSAYSSATRGRHWYYYGLLHSYNGRPAFARKNVRKWYHHGKLHRDHDAAVIRTNGTREWWQHGERHRDDDLPAITGASGFQHWYCNGVLHREDLKPAKIHANGLCEWWFKGIRCRDNTQIPI